jgi:hyperosmotically inducible periplasmic protein
MDRKVSLVTAAIACAFAGAVFAADSGNVVDDSYLTTKVKAELTTDSATKARHISVKTKDGVVALTGKVDSKAEKEKAEQDARSVKGVVDVINKLEVKE